MIEPCPSCECDYLQTSGSYGSLKFASKNCGRYSAGYLVDFLPSVRSSKSDNSGSTTLWIRFKSDETVHHKGFNFSYIAGSAGGKFD